MAINLSTLSNPTQGSGPADLVRSPSKISKVLSRSVGFSNRLDNRNDLISHAEMCQMLGISTQTGYDWRNPKSKRFKEDLATLAIYLSERTVRFRRGDVKDFALRKQQESK